MRGWGIALAVVGVVLGVLAQSAWHVAGERGAAGEAAALRDLLGLGPGMTVAEVGAGDGAIAIEVARIVGPTGRVFANELDGSLVDAIRHRAREGGVANLTAVRASEQDTNLPPGCCRVIYMRRVYHDLSDPAHVVSSISRALAPDGRLAIIDFEPTLVGDLLMPRRTTRTGHGVTRFQLLGEMRGFGFIPQHPPAAWSGGMFVVVFTASPQQRRARIPGVA